MQTDGGCEGKLEAEGLPDTLLPVTARHVPAHLLPTGQTARSRPDGLMVWTDDNKERHVRVLEIKVTSDTDPARALCTAEHQHADLLTLLRKPSDGVKVATAKVLPLAFGATGVMYAATLAHLIDLGVDSGRADSLLREVALELARRACSAYGERCRLAPRDARSNKPLVAKRPRGS